MQNHITARISSHIFHIGLQKVKYSMSKLILMSGLSQASEMERA